MKSYPNIPTIGLPLLDSGKKLPFDLSAMNWIGFNKLDGSLIRAEWKDVKGFYKFGRKNALLDDTNPVLKEAPSLIERDYGFLKTVFQEFGWMRGVCFFEFAGRNSFAGQHQDEHHKVSLIDISLHPKGLVDPKELALMDVVGGSKVLHRGPVTREVIKSIFHRRMKGMTLEGVVFKRINSKGHREMFKTKSEFWYEKLKEKCKGNKKLFTKLS